MSHNGQTSMKRILLATLMLVGFGAAFQAAKADVDVSVDFFYDNLSGGNWIEVGDYGYCWQPDVAVNDAGWRPYADGYWAYTDEGWTWVSYEDFGWATYHYGRWAHLADLGWVWVPGRNEDLEWGPAWVSWRTGDEYIGWAPLPPTGELFYEGRTISGYVDLDFDIGPACYNFVEIRYIGEPVLRERLIVSTQNITYINQTVNVTNITYKNKIVYNDGPDINVINRRAGRPIQRLTIQREKNVDLAAVAKSGGLKSRVHGQALVVAAPAHIAKSTRQSAPRAVKTRVAKANLDNGWSGVGDAKAREQYKQKLRSEDRNKMRGAAAGVNAGAPTGNSPMSSPAASVGAGSRTEFGKGEKHNRSRSGEGVQAEAAAGASPAGAGASTSAGPGFERGKEGRRHDRQSEPNPSAGSGMTPLPVTPPVTTVPETAGQGGGKHERRDQGALGNEGQFQGQPAGGASPNFQGEHRVRRLDQGTIPPGASSPPDLQGGPGASGGRHHDRGQEQGVSGQPGNAVGGSQPVLQDQSNQGRHEGGKKNRGETSPGPSPQ